MPDTGILKAGESTYETNNHIFICMHIITDITLSAVCDYELGRSTDRSELENPGLESTWFPNDSLGDYSVEKMNSDYYDKVYPLIRDCPLRTTENTRRVLANNFPGEEWAAREPRVSKGTAVSSDSYWKGDEDHGNADFIAEYYECPDEYAVTEMEEISIMNAAECFGLEDRVISLRVIVNLDTFLEGENPELLWIEGEYFNDKVVNENSETLDIFESGMNNLFDVGRIVIDTILAGEL